MANLYFSVPVVPGGLGVAVDISAAGAQKTIVVRARPSAVVTLEISEDGGITWCQLVSFTGGGGKKVISFAANRIRARTSGEAFEVDIGANDDGGMFVTIPPPPLNGVGTPVNITALGNFTTVVVQGGLAGGVIGIQISENGVDFAEAMTFSTPGCQSKSMIGDFARAVSRGASSAIPYSPVCSMGAINEEGIAPPAPGDKYAPPEQWVRNNVAAGLAAVPLNALVSTSFDTIKMIRPGSIVGLGTRFSEAVTDANAGSAVVTVTINGAPGTLAVSSDAGTNPSGGQAVQAAGIDTFVAGDTVGIQITTLGTFAPITTDVEAWLEMEI